MKADIRNSLKQFLLELVVYAVMVTAYYLFVLHLLGPGLKNLYDHERRVYAALALALIVGQGLFLEVVTRLLMRWIQPRTED
jgi:hypothetical protein